MYARSNDPSKPPVGGGGRVRAGRGEGRFVTSASNQEWKMSSLSVVTSNASLSINSSVSAAATSRGTSAKPTSAVFPARSCIGIQVPFMNPQTEISSAQPVNKVGAAPRVIVVRPKVKIPTTLRRNITRQTGVPTQTQFLNTTSQASSSGLVSAGSHIMQTENDFPTASIQPLAPLSNPSAAGVGGFRAPTPPLLAPKLPRIAPRPQILGLQNIQQPAGEPSFMHI